MSTLKENLMQRYGLSESQATRALNSSTTQRILILLGEEKGLLQSAAVEALRARERALDEMEAEMRNREIKSRNRMAEAVSRDSAADRKLAEAEGLKKTADEINARTQEMLAEMRALETAGGRDKLRLLNIFLALRGTGPDGRYSQSYLSACASILSGIPLEQTSTDAQ